MKVLVTVRKCLDQDPNWDKFQNPDLKANTMYWDPQGWCWPCPPNGPKSPFIALLFSENDAAHHVHGTRKMGVH